MASKSDTYIRVSGRVRQSRHIRRTGSASAASDPARVLRVKALRFGFVSPTGLGECAWTARDLL